MFSVFFWSHFEITRICPKSCCWHDTPIAWEPTCRENPMFHGGKWEYERNSEWCVSRGSRTWAKLPSSGGCFQLYTTHPKKSCHFIKLAHLPNWGDESGNGYIRYEPWWKYETRNWFSMTLAGFVWFKMTSTTVALQFPEFLAEIRRICGTTLRPVLEARVTDFALLLRPHSENWNLS